VQSRSSTGCARAEYSGSPPVATTLRPSGAVIEVAVVASFTFAGGMFAFVTFERRRAAGGIHTHPAHSPRTPRRAGRMRA
jgi:hypothetical protein